MYLHYLKLQKAKYEAIETQKTWDQLFTHLKSQNQLYQHNALPNNRNVEFGLNSIYEGVD